MKLESYAGNPVAKSVSGYITLFLTQNPKSTSIS